MPNLNLYRSPLAARMTRKTKKNKRNNNTYVPSNTEAPELNLSYVKNRNESVRNALNEVMVGRNFYGSRPNLSNNQKAARIEVARKMARGEPINYREKISAGIVTFPKPTGPRPVKKGGKTCRNRKH